MFDCNGDFSDVMGISVEYGDIIDDILVISDILVKYVAFLKSGAIPSHHPYFYGIVHEINHHKPTSYHGVAL